MTQLLEDEIFNKRRSLGMSQYTLANEVGVTRNCIQKLECYEHLPKVETLFEIMRALGFDDDESVVFLRKYLYAYYDDKEFQLEKELAGTV